MNITHQKVRALLLKNRFDVGKWSGCDRVGNQNFLGVLKVSKDYDDGVSIRWFDKDKNSIEKVYLCLSTQLEDFKVEKDETLNIVRILPTTRRCKNE